MITITTAITIINMNKRPWRQYEQTVSTAPNPTAPVIVSEHVAETLYV